MLTNLNELQTIIAKAKSNGQAVVFTNGCFDILHAGHCKYLAEAKKLGDILVVGVNTDESIKRIKGKERPINKQTDRAFVLSALRAVDYTIFFGEDTPAQLIDAIVPDVLVKGADYDVREIVGAETVLKNGGKVITIPLVAGLSTSNTLKKIQGKL